MNRDLRDPRLLGETLLFWAENQNCKVSEVHSSLVKVADYEANPSTIEKYGRPQELPSTLPN